MRLKKGEWEFIGLQRVCRVATVNREGVPHNVPVCLVLDGGRIYFASAADGTKVRNIQATGHVAMAFDEYTEVWSGLKGILVWGTGRVIETGPTFRQVRKLLYRRYPQYEGYAALEEEASVIVEVTPTRKFSWGL